MPEKLTHEHLDELAFAHLRHDLNPIDSRATVGEALASLRRQNLGERLVYLFVTEADGRLVGVIPTRRLLMSELDTPVSTLMVRDVKTLPSHATVREASRMLLDTRLLALPVVDSEGRLHGVIDVSLFRDIDDIASRQSTDDVFQLIGIHLTGRRTPWQQFRDRFPWLLTNITGGLLAAGIAGLFESLLHKLVVLALFIPVVLALAESVSIQSVTLTLQALHAATPDWRALGRSLWTEAPAALLLGLGCGLIVGGVAGVWHGGSAVGLGLAAVIAASMVIAALLGVLLPMLLRLLRRDPRIAAGPIVLASADIATLLLYFNLFQMLAAR